MSDYRQFSDIYISQGSVATYVMCGGIFKYSAATKNILHRIKTHSAVIDRGVNPRLKYAERQLDVVLLEQLSYHASLLRTFCYIFHSARHSRQL